MKRIYAIILIAAILVIFHSCRTSEKLDSNTSCTPVSEVDFYRSLARVNEEDFDREKESIAARETRDLGCLTSEQIKAFAGTLRFERARLSYMKFAHSYCSNTTNYYDTMKYLLQTKRSKQDLENWTR
jgi:hypothetical protein